MKSEGLLLLHLQEEQSFRPFLSCFQLCEELASLLASFLSSLFSPFYLSFYLFFVFSIELIWKVLAICKSYRQSTFRPYLCGQIFFFFVYLPTLLSGDLIFFAIHGNIFAILWTVTCRGGLGQLTTCLSGKCELLGQVRKANLALVHKFREISL